MAVRRLAEPHLQPKEFSFSADNLAWAKKQIAKYPEGRQQSAVIPLLWRAQEQAGGWLPQKAIEHVAQVLGMANIRVLEVATFYTMFNLAPVGEFHVQMCGTTPCRLRGADALLDIAATCGIDPELLEESLAEGEFTDLVIEDEEFAKKIGVTGVPFAVLSRDGAPGEEPPPPIALRGAAPVQHFEAAVERLFPDGFPG